MLKPDYLDFDKDGNKTESMKEAIKDRDMKNYGGLLADDREQYMSGGISKLMSKAIGIPNPNFPIFYKSGTKIGELTPKNAKLMLENIEYVEKLRSKKFDEISAEGMEAQIMRDKHEPNSKEYKKYDKILEEKNELFGELEKEADMMSFQKERLKRFLKDGKLDPDDPKNYFNKGGDVDASMDERNTWQEGGDVEEQMSMLMGPTHTMPDGTVMPGATHEEGEMSMEEPEMESDSEMEDNYLDFIIDEALSEEEEDMLMSKLEQDEELSMLFDKVIEVASEFAGSGPVEGPGTGVSDSIPARLSDGEFVFTAKAVEEIGADNLMAMMKEAEMKADERQGMANGGTPEDEEENVVVEPTTPDIPTQVVRVEKPSVGLLSSAQEQQDLVGDEIKKRMMDPSTQARYVRS